MEMAAAAAGAAAALAMVPSVVPAAVLAVLLAALAAAAAAALAGAYYFSERLLRNKVRDDRDIAARELENGLISRERLESLAAHRIELRSPAGYRLRAFFVPADGGETRRTVVFAHGVTSSLTGMLKYAELFLRRGFNALLYDHRRHGESEGEWTSYGYYEKDDLKAAVDWVCRRHGADAVVGVFGESMGAATVLEFAAADGRPAFVVSDCAFSDLGDQLAYLLRVEYRLPRVPLLALTSLWCRLRAGFYIRDVSPRRAAARIRAPLLIVHGLADDYVLPEMARELYEHAAAPVKELCLVPGAAHAGSLAADRAAYERRLDEFLAKAGVGSPLRESAPPARG